MSYYYNYYLGYKDKEDGLFYPLGPFDNNGKINCVFYKSRSYASDLHEDFYNMKEEDYSEQLKNVFSFEDYEKKIVYEDLAYLPLSELPSSDYIKKGYFLIKDVERYLEDENRLYNMDIFYDHIDSELYSLMLKNELSIGPRTQEYDCEGEPLEQHSCADYVYFAYPDYLSKEYECHLLNNAASIYEDITYKGKEIVVLKTEG